MAQSYVARLIDARLAGLTSEFGAVMVIGPRASGKTTSARRLATSVLRLDREDQADAVRADPDVVLAGLEPTILVDEWQLEPSVLAAVKRAVDDGDEPGQFILTGSVRAELLESTWAATGRVIPVTQWGFTERELRERTSQTSWFDLAFDNSDVLSEVPSEQVNIRDYLEIAFRGMLPDVALRRSESARQDWWDAYIHQMITRDARLAAEDRDPVKLRAYLNAVCANTSGVVSHKTIYDSAGVSRVTGEAYESLLELLFVTENLPAWHSNRLTRLNRRPKRYVTDPGLAAAVLGVDVRAALRSGDLMGRLIDTFMVAQLRPELAVARTRPRLHHLRLESGRREVDIVAEARDGRILAIEIKAAGSTNAADATHLRWLRDKLGDQFAAGILFHTGSLPYAIDSNIRALPISSIWSHRS